MRTKLLVLVLASLPVLVSQPVLSASADSRQDMMEKIADVVALARVCPTLQMNSGIVTTVALSQKIGGRAGDYDAIDAMANAREGTIRRGDQMAECESGRQQYGPGGDAFPGLLQLRAP